MPTEIMELIEKKIARLLRIPGVLNWARQNYQRTEQIERALRKLAEGDIAISLNPVYSLCARVAYRELTFDEAISKALTYKGFHRLAATEILPLFGAYLANRQYQAISDFRDLRAPFPIGKAPNGKVSSIPVRPTFVTIREGKLHPVFLLGWVDAPLTVHQRRLVSAVVRRALLTQQDFMGSDAEVVTFPRFKGQKERYQGGWLISDFEDLSDDQLSQQVTRYNNALERVIAGLQS